MLCREGTCEGAFRVSDIPAFGNCGRRTEVIADDDATNRVLAPLLERSRPRANGMFELRFRLHWPRGQHALIEALTQELDLRHLGTLEGGRSIDVASAPPADIAMLLDSIYGPNWIEQVSAEVSDEAAQRRKFEQEARQERWWDLSRWTAFWGSFLIVLSVLLHSIHLFFLRLHRRAGRRHDQPLRTPLLIQAGVGTICICIPFLTRFESWPGVFLLPALATILLAEAWAWFFHGEPKPGNAAGTSKPVA